MNVHATDDELPPDVAQQNGLKALEILEAGFVKASVSHLLRSHSSTTAGVSIKGLNHSKILVL
jgi:hypothetical protein